MFLELTSVPLIEQHGGAIGFASMPWQSPLLEGASLQVRVQRTQDAFITEYGPGTRFRLVLESQEEWNRYVAGDSVAASVLLVLPMSWRERRVTLAGWLGVDSIEFGIDRELTPLEIVASSEIATIRVNAEAALAKKGFPYGRLQWELAEEQSRKNLARAAEAAGVKIVAPEPNVLERLIVIGVPREAFAHHVHWIEAREVLAVFAPVRGLRCETHDHGPLPRKPCSGLRRVRPTDRRVPAIRSHQGSPPWPD